MGGGNEKKNEYKRINREFQLYTKNSTMRTNQTLPIMTRANVQKKKRVFINSVAHVNVGHTTKVERQKKIYEIWFEETVSLSFYNERISLIF